MKRQFLVRAFCGWVLQQRLLLLLAASFLAVGCEHKPAVEPEPSSPTAKSPSPAAPSLSAVQPTAFVAIPPANSGAARPSGPIEFVDITAQAGIHFKHNSGAFGKKYLPETMGSGVCFIDYDNDGWQDIFFVNSRDSAEHQRERKSSPP